MIPHECDQKENVEKLASKVDEVCARLGTGDVLLATMNQTLGGHTDVLKEIKEQTLKTNGRVNKLEKWRTWVIGLCLGVGINGVVAIVKIVLEHK